MTPPNRARQLNSSETIIWSHIQNLDQYPDTHDFGTDINQANLVLFSTKSSAEEKIKTLKSWVFKSQPCMFGRMAVKKVQGLSLDICFIEQSDLEAGDSHVVQKIQDERRQWKLKAEKAESHGFLVFFNIKALAYAKPSSKLVEVCKLLAGCYLVEHAPIEADVIYSEAIPLRMTDQKLKLFKAGVNIFYGGAHSTRNHDRRMPGGLLISVNAVGHYTQALVMKGMVADLNEAVTHTKFLAWLSIGNGGFGNENLPSATWHNRDSTIDESERPAHGCPAYIPKDFSTKTYSGFYHTDVLVPSSVTADATDLKQSEGKYETLESWNDLEFEYLNSKETIIFDPNYGFVQGHPIPEKAKFDNPWPPVRPVKSKAAECPFKKAK